MCRYVLLALVATLVLLMAGAAVAVQVYGWPGFFVFLAALVVLVFVSRWWLPQLLAYLFTRPLRRMGAALKGARIVVHSVTPCDPPVAEDWDPDAELSDDAGERPRLADRRRDDDDYDEDPDSDPAADEEGDEDEAEGPLDWYRIEFSVIPADANESVEGRFATRSAWMPQMIGAVSGRPDRRRASPFRGWPALEQFSGMVQHDDIEIWTEDGYQPPAEEVFGEHRLRLRVGVTREVRAVTITYVHFTNLGEVNLPRIDVRPGQGP